MSSRTTPDGGVWCIEYAADQNEIRSVVERGDHHRQAKALVTVGGAPSGYIEFPLPIDELQPSWMAELVKDLSAGSVPSSPPPPPDVDLPLASVIVCTSKTVIVGSNSWILRVRSRATAAGSPDVRAT